MTETAPLRLGLLGAANIARQFTAAVAGSTKISVNAVASRGADRAAAYAAETGIPRWHDSYEALLADPEIDAVYIPLPNNLHAEWTVRALEAGKHVLCEKPLAMSGDEAAAMFATARTSGRFLAEAYPWLSQPQTAQLRALLADGAIGTVRQIAVSFSAPFSDPANIRLKPENGGGAILDLGSYCVSFLRLVAGSRPRSVMAMPDWSETGVDRGVAAVLRFADGLTATLNCSFAVEYQRIATILGTQGSIVTGFRNHMAEPMQIWRGGALTTVPEVLTTPKMSGFLAEAEAFADTIALGPEHWSGADASQSLDIALTLEALAQSARSGTPITLPGEDE